MTTLRLDEGLVYDTRCLLEPHHDRMVLDYEFDAPRSEAWTFIAVVRVNPNAVDINKEVGIVFGDDNFSFIMGSRNLLELTRWGGVWWVVKPAAASHMQDMRTGDWCVLGFTADSTTLRFYFNGQLLDEHVVQPHERPTVEEISGNLCLGGSNNTSRRKNNFKGEILRLVVYNRTLESSQMKLLAHDYLNPRIVSISGTSNADHYYTAQEVSCVKFMYTDGYHASYGDGLAAADDDDNTALSRSSLQLDWDEHIVTVSGMHSVYGEHVARCFSARTNKNNYLHVGGGALEEPDWEFQTKQGHEIYGLQIVEKTYEGMRVTGVLERPLLEAQAIDCREQVERGYLGRLNMIKEEVRRIAKTKHLPLEELPVISDWDYEANRVWLNALDTVMLEQTRFLECCLIDDSSPALYTSATTAVFRATYIDPEIDSVNGRHKTRHVALKFMVEPAQVLAELLGRDQVEPDHVVAVSAVFSEEGIAKEHINAYPGRHGPLQHNGRPVLVQSVRGLSERMQQVTGMPKSRYQYCLVLELADVSLHQALVHEHFAGRDWNLIRKITVDVCKALHQLHRNHRIHADLKPLSIMRVGTQWKLIDLDVSRGFNFVFGDKIPTCGYCPPEMARALLQAMDDNGAVNVKRLKECCPKAGIAYDLWGLGCVLCEMVFNGNVLWATDQDDNISKRSDLKKLADWDAETRDRKLCQLVSDGNNVQMLAAKDLIEKLLDPSETARVAHFKAGSELLSVQEHFFFSGFHSTASGDGKECNLKDHNRNDHENRKAELLEQWVVQKATLLEENRQQEIIEESVNDIVGKLAALFASLSKVMSEANGITPKYLCFLPVQSIVRGPDARSELVELLTHPSEWFGRGALFFVDPVSLALAPTNSGNGFRIKLPKEWIATAVPFLKLGLTALKAAALANRLGGIPAPEIASTCSEFVDAQIAALDCLGQDSIAAFDNETSGDTDDSAKHPLQEVNELCEAMFKRIAESGGAAKIEHQISTTLARSIKKSAQELSTLMAAEYPNWKEQCGLVMVTATDRCTEWVLPTYQNEFQTKGELLLGTKSKAQARQYEADLASRFHLDVKQVSVAKAAKVEAAKAKETAARLEELRVEALHAAALQVAAAKAQVEAIAAAKEESEAALLERMKMAVAKAEMRIITLQEAKAASDQAAEDARALTKDTIAARLESEAKASELVKAAEAKVEVTKETLAREKEVAAAELGQAQARAKEAHAALDETRAQLAEEKETAAAKLAQTLAIAQEAQEALEEMTVAVAEEKKAAAVQVADAQGIAKDAQDALEAIKAALAEEREAAAAKLATVQASVKETQEALEEANAALAQEQETAATLVAQAEANALKAQAALEQTKSELANEKETAATRVSQALMSAQEAQDALELVEEIMEEKRQRQVRARDIAERLEEVSERHSNSDDCTCRIM